MTSINGPMKRDAVQVPLQPSSDSAHVARVAVADFLVRLGRGDLIDDVRLIATELVGNVVMHAHTAMSLTIEPTAAGVRVTVADGSCILPRWTLPSPTATAGRGLALVQRVSDRWGFVPLPGGGKCVWAEIDAPSSNDDDSSPEDLLELWAGEPWPGDPIEDDAEVEIEVDIDVRAMLESRAHTEEIVRDLQLTLLNGADAATPTEAAAQVVRLAQRLNDANEDFHEGRRQIYNQTIRADQRRHTRTTLRLRLHKADATLARRWLAALDEADALTAAGTLLLPPFPPELTAFRRNYIAAIVEQLEASA